MSYRSEVLVNEPDSWPNQLTAIHPSHVSYIPIDLLATRGVSWEQGLLPVANQDGNLNQEFINLSCIIYSIVPYIMCECVSCISSEIFFLAENGQISRTLTALSPLFSPCPWWAKHWDAPATDDQSSGAKLWESGWWMVSAEVCRFYSWEDGVRGWYDIKRTSYKSIESHSTRIWWEDMLEMDGMVTCANLNGNSFCWTLCFKWMCPSVHFASQFQRHLQ